MSAQVYDNHTIYVRCEGASASQVKDVFLDALSKYNFDNKTNLPGSFHVNLVETREKVSLGFAFAFFTNPAAYHMILGKNTDGSDRIEYRDDPSWVSPVENWSTTYDEGSSWGDMSEKEQSKECPKIPITLDPLITLPAYKLTQEQIQTKKNLIIAYNKDKEGFLESMVEVPDHAFLLVSPAIVTPLEDKFVPNILKAKNVPPWVTEHDLKIRFAPYATNSTTVVDRVVKGRRFKETYPFVNINDDRIAFLIFDPCTHDAQFALHMTKKLPVTRKMDDGKIFSTTLLFNHSFSTDRDKMSEIVNKPIVMMAAKADPPKRQPPPKKKEKTNKYSGLVVSDEE